MLAFVNPEADPQGHRVSHSAVADRGGNGRDSRAWLDGGAAEAVLSAGGADRLYLCQYLRGAGLDWSAAGRRDCLWRWHIAGCGRRSFRLIPFARFLAFGLTTAILIQAFFNMSVVLALLPTKGIPLAVYFVGRDVDLYYAGEHGCAAEYYARDRLRAVCVASQQLSNYGF